MRESDTLHIKGGHIKGGHIKGGHIKGGHIKGGHIKGGHIKGGHIKGGHIMATLTQTENRIRPLYIDGYTHQLSYAPGEEIAFNVSTSAGNYSLEIARIGATREVVFNESGLPGGGTTDS